MGAGGLYIACYFFGASMIDDALKFLMTGIKLDMNCIHCENRHHPRCLKSKTRLILVLLCVLGQRIQDYPVVLGFASCQVANDNDRDHNQKHRTQEQKRTPDNVCNNYNHHERAFPGAHPEGQQTIHNTRCAWKCKVLGETIPCFQINPEGQRDDPRREHHRERMEVGFWGVCKSREGSQCHQHPNKQHTSCLHSKALTFRAFGVPAWP